MKALNTSIPGLVVIEPEVFGDDRGFFMESFNQKDFTAAVNSAVNFVQDNHSRSSRGVLRGLHYQIERPQGKLVRVSSGAAFDVAVDLRKNSQTFGKWYGIELTAENKRQLWIPPGFAHGFLVLQDATDFLYKTTDYYHPEHERCVLWSDDELAIDWPKLNIEYRLSPKDQRGVPFVSCESFA